MKHKIIGVILLLLIASCLFAACSTKVENGTVDAKIDDEIVSSLPATVEVTGAEELSGTLSVSTLSDADKAIALGLIRSDYYVAEDATTYALDVKLVSGGKEVSLDKPVTLAVTLKSPLLSLDEYVVFAVRNNVAAEITPRVDGSKLTFTVTELSAFVVLPRHLHTLQTNSTATCSEAGLTIVSCSVCKQVTETITAAPLGHDLRDVAAKAPTESEIGWNAYQVCTRCGEKVGYTELPAHVHLYENWETVTSPTCTSKGSEKATCSCGKEQTRDLPPLGHDPIYHAAQASTCTENGNIEYYTCSRCRRYYIDEDLTKETTLNAVLTAPAHTLVYRAAVAYTCTEAGNLAHYACSVCESLFEDERGAKSLSAEQVVLPARHNMNFHSAEDATCTEAGNLAYYRCTVCQKYYTDADGAHETTEEAVTLVALRHLDENGDDHCDRCGKYVGEREYVYFGSYPQTLASEEVGAALTATLSQEDYPTQEDDKSWTFYGYYLSDDTSVHYVWYLDTVYELDRYRGVYFTAYRPYLTNGSESYQDDNGYQTATVYWFKYEPIKWRVLAKDEGKALLLSDAVIDSHEYCAILEEDAFLHNDGTGYANDYALSDIRKWLIDTFFDAAFSSSEKDAILQEENTEDFIFLLGEEEITNGEYGFNAADEFDEFRRLLPTDYAESQGVYVFGGNGVSNWWLRSPASEGSTDVQIVSVMGFISMTSELNDTSVGVVPALWIDLTAID